MYNDRTICPWACLTNLSLYIPIPIVLPLLLLFLVFRVALEFSVVI